MPARNGVRGTGTCCWTTEKISALVDNIRGGKDRIIDGEVMKKDDGDG
jgi:hypothetical protein